MVGAVFPQSYPQMRRKLASITVRQLLSIEIKNLLEVLVRYGAFYFYLHVGCWTIKRTSQKSFDWQ